MKKIVTIGGGNGHSNLLSGIYLSDYFSEINLKSIVSMSDDGRTTGDLMDTFESELGLHLPPPGDLRRCLFKLSSSPFRKDYERFFETVIASSRNIGDFTLRELFLLVGADSDFIGELERKNIYFLDFSLPISRSISGHKFGNILMACLYYNFLRDYNYMLKFMHYLLDVNSSVIPVTTDRASIRAILDTGEVIEKQDSISNSDEYQGRIVKLELMDEVTSAVHNFKIDKAVLGADYIVISAGDLFTSTISNLIIGGMRRLIKKTNAKIIYIGNNTNKGGETKDYNVLDFIIILENYLGKKIDYFITNNATIDLSSEQSNKFKSDISVKGGDYIYLTDLERKFLLDRGTSVIEDDLIDRKSLYKHDNKKLSEKIKGIIF